MFFLGGRGLWERGFFNCFLGRVRGCVFGVVWVFWVFWVFMVLGFLGLPTWMWVLTGSRGEEVVGGFVVGARLLCAWQILLQCAGPRCHQLSRTFPASQSLQICGRS